jgi:long-chain acyl-CoA synthetase
MNEFKLVDVPEMEYLSTDMEDGVSTPRGEVCLRGPAVICGYFDNPVITNETIDKDGWLHTGDIGMVLSNGIIIIHIYMYRSSKDS